MALFWIKKFNFHLGIIKEHYNEGQIQDIIKNGEFGDRLKDKDYFVYLNPNPKVSEQSYRAEVRCWETGVGVTHIDEALFDGELEEVMKKVQAWFEEIWANKQEEIRFTRTFS